MKLTTFLRLAVVLATTVLVSSCASSSLASLKPIDRRTAADQQRLFIKGAEIHALGLGYTTAGNRPIDSARIELTGRAEVGTVTRVVLNFYPPGDSRVSNPFYNADRTKLTVNQTLAALPGWIATVTAIPSNESVTFGYYAVDGHYEFECLRILTRK